MNYLDTGKVAYPKLSLYAFHLWRNLAQGMENPVNNAKDLWLKFQEIGQALNTPELEKLPELIETNNHQLGKNGELLPKPNYLKFAEIPQSNNQNIKGDILPLQIHDTYAVDLTLRYPQPEVKLSDLKGLNKDNCLLPDNINASLGQTLVFFATPLEEFENQESLQNFADDCVKALITSEKFQELKIYCQSQGKLLGSPIFEYNNDADSPKEQCHILIWLNTNPETKELENSGKYYYPLIKLLLCRSKIIYVNNQAIRCNQQARKEYTELEKIVSEFNQIKNNINQNLEKLQQWLMNVPEVSFEYARYLRDLQIHRTTIRTNLENYRLNLNIIDQLCNQDDLQFLSNFIKLTQNTYIQQININLEYLTPANDFFKQMIETIRGVVEIEEAKRDKSLQETVQVLGVALGGGAIVSGVVAEYIEKPVTLPIYDNYQIQPIMISLIWSFLATLFFGLLAFGWTQLGRKGSN
ncbi:MAG: hypothetical protein AAF915_12330 [Cyanobacteria bacterium P01_D01_bin.50]